MSANIIIIIPQELMQIHDEYRSFASTIKKQKGELLEHFDQPASIISSPASARTSFAVSSSNYLPSKLARRRQCLEQVPSELSDEITWGPKMLKRTIVLVLQVRLITIHDSCHGIVNIRLGSLLVLLAKWPTQTRARIVSPTCERVRALTLQVDLE
jgi:hypothetical protein